MAKKKVAKKTAKKAKKVKAAAKRVVKKAKKVLKVKAQPSPRLRSAGKHAPAKKPMPKPMAKPQKTAGLPSVFTKAMPHMAGKQPEKKAQRLALQPDASGKKPVGVITHYYDRIGVGVLRLAEPIRVGDMIRVKKGDTEFTQKIVSMQINRKQVEKANANDDVAIKVDKPAHEGSRIYKA